MDKTTKEVNKKVDYLLRGGMVVVVACGIGLGVIAWPAKEQKKGPQVESKVETIENGNSKIFRNTFRIPADPKGRYAQLNGVVEVEKDAAGTCEPYLELYVQPDTSAPTGVTLPLSVHVRGSQFEELERQVNKSVISCENSAAVQ
jgi:hypothetical protein